MIPLRLHIRNFLCYREDVPSLDFTGIHLACLCGPNGHGKSALLDAITWSLWGKARGRTQDELISYGADECRVELDFQARGTSFRVVRSHARGGGRRRQGASDLQLMVLGEGDPRPISGNVIRETQLVIDQAVGMDYDTFINSAFLLQGRADEFTNKTPAERKAVLAKVLGLDTYDRLQARAKERLERSRSLADEAAGLLEMMQLEMKAIGDPWQEMTEVTQRLESVKGLLVEKKEEVAGIREQVSQLGRLRDQLTETATRFSSIAQEIKHLETAAAGAGNRIREFRLLLDQSAAIQDGAGRLQKTRGKYEALEESRQEFDGLDRERSTLDKSINEKRARLETEIVQLKRRAEVDLPPRAGRAESLLAELVSVQAKLDALKSDGEAVASSRRKHSQLSTQTGEAQSAAERCKAEGQELVSKLAMLTPANSEDAVCPLCRTPLSEDGCRNLAGVYQGEIEAKRDLYRRNAARLQKLEADRETMGRDLSQQEESLAAARRKGEVKLQELEGAIKQSREADEELEQVAAELRHRTKSLDLGEFAAEEKSRLEGVVQRIVRLAYDDEVRRQAYRETQELEHFAEQHRRLAQAETDLPREEEALAQNQGMLERRRVELEELKRQRQDDQESVKGLPDWQTLLLQAEREEQALDRDRQQADSRRGYLEAQLQRLQTLKEEKAKKTASLSFLRDDQGIFQELVATMGRQGVQAMLIETVVPTLEEEANSLLGRMTDNRMNLKLETQRERRTGQGDPIETLEINVSDELGPRSYEMYSGGEAFRINLALRIALSRVLAGRMGAPLPILFIDEGFGTQDAAGRERILDVIGSIENEFEKIIVVTHLDELKDAFPVRIEVQKGEMGSTFWLS